MCVNRMMKVQPLFSVDRSTPLNLKCCLRKKKIMIQIMVKKRMNI